MFGQKSREKQKCTYISEHVVHIRHRPSTVERQYIRTLLLLSFSALPLLSSLFSSVSTTTEENTRAHTHTHTDRTTPPHKGSSIEPVRSSVHLPSLFLTFSLIVNFCQKKTRGLVLWSAALTPAAWPRRTSACERSRSVRARQQRRQTIN